MIDKYTGVFRNELGTMEAVESHIHVPESAHQGTFNPNCKDQWSEKLSTFKKLVP